MFNKNIKSHGLLLSGNEIGKPMKYAPSKNIILEARPGANLINGIEFGNDEVTVRDPETGTVTFVEVQNIYPSINSYIAEKMDFDEVALYNDLQETYFENASNLLFAERVKYLLESVLNETKIMINKVKSVVEEREMGLDYEDFYLNFYMRASDVIELLPQLVDPYFYNTIRNTGGIVPNKELLEVTCMAYASILLDNVSLHCKYPQIYKIVFEKIDEIIKLAAVSLFNMINNILTTDNISNLSGYYPTFHNPSEIGQFNLEYKLK